MTEDGRPALDPEVVAHDRGWMQGFLAGKRQGREFDVRDLAEKAGLKTFDTALPLPWYDDVHAKTGYWPQSYGFVWCYDAPTVWGEPYPLTDKAQMVLRLYSSKLGYVAGYNYLNVPVVEI